MRRFLRLSLIVLAFLFVWTLTALVWFKYQVRSGLMKSRVEALLERAWGRPGKIVSLRVAGLRRVEMEGLSVTGPTGLENLCRADSLAVDASWSSLLSFGFEPERLVVVRPCIRLVKEDWKSWWPADRLVGRVGAALGSFRPPAMTLAVEGGSILFEDRSGSELFRWTIGGIDFSLAAEDWERELSFRHPLDVGEGRLELSGRLVPRSLRGVVHLRGKNLDVAGLGRRFFRGGTKLEAARVDVQGQLELRGGVDSYELEWSPRLDLALAWPFAATARFEGKITSEPTGSTISGGLLSVKDMGDFAVTGKIFEFPDLNAELRVEGLGLSVEPFRKQAYRLHPSLVALLARLDPRGQVDLHWAGRGSFATGRIDSSGSLKDVGRLTVRPFGEVQGLRFHRATFRRDRIVLGNLRLEGKPTLRLDLQVVDPWGLHPAVEASLGSEGFPAVLALAEAELPFDLERPEGGVGLEFSLRGTMPARLTLEGEGASEALRDFLLANGRGSVDLRGFSWQRGEARVEAAGKIVWDGKLTRAENLELRAGDAVLRISGSVTPKEGRPRLKAAWALQRSDGDMVDVAAVLPLLPPATAASWRRYRPEGSFSLRGDLEGWRGAWLAEGKGRFEDLILSLGAEGKRSRVDFGDLALAFNESRVQVLADRLHVDELPVAYDLDVVRYSTGWELRAHLSSGDGTVPPTALAPFLPEELVRRLEGLGARFKGTVGLEGAVFAPRARLQGTLDAGGRTLLVDLAGRDVGAEPAVQGQIGLAEGQQVDASRWDGRRLEELLGLEMRPVGVWSKAVVKLDGSSQGLGATLLAEGVLGGGACRLVGRRSHEKGKAVTDLRLTADLPRAESFLSAFPIIATTVEAWNVGGGLRLDGRCRLEDDQARSAAVLEVAEGFVDPVLAGVTLPLRGILGRLRATSDWTLGGRAGGASLAGTLTGRLELAGESFPLELRSFSLSRPAEDRVTAAADLVVEGQLMRLKYDRETILGGRVHDLSFEIPSFDLVRLVSLHGRAEGRPARLVKGTASLSLRLQGSERHPDLEGSLVVKDLEFLAEGAVGEGVWTVPEIRFDLGLDDAKLHPFDVFRGRESQPFPLQGSLKGILDVDHLWTALRDRRSLLWQRFLSRMDTAWGRKTRDMLFGRERDVQGRVAPRLKVTLRLWIMDRDEPYEFEDELDARESEDFGFVFRREEILKKRIERAKTEVARRQGFKLSGFGVHQDRMIKLRKTEVLVEDERGNLVWPDAVPAWRRPRN